MLDRADHRYLYGLLQYYVTCVQTRIPNASSRLSGRRTANNVRDADNMFLTVKGVDGEWLSHPRRMRYCRWPAGSIERTGIPCTRGPVDLCCP